MNIDVFIFQRSPALDQKSVWVVITSGYCSEKSFGDQPAGNNTRGANNPLRGNAVEAVRVLYLWFIGVHPESQNKGVGKYMLEELLAEAERMDRAVYLETSTLKNVPWYRKFGLDVYNQLDFGYNLFLIRNGR